MKRNKINSSAANFTLDFETISIVVTATSFSLIAFSLAGEGSLSTHKIITKEDIQAVWYTSHFFSLLSLMYIARTYVITLNEMQDNLTSKDVPDDDREIDSNHSMLIGSP